MKSDVRFATVFIGGGTPSLCPPQEIARILEKVPLTTNAEITMEANPGATEYMDFTAFRQAGINRLSIGAQSFDASQLQQLGRIHGPEETAYAFSEARAGGFDNINLDLMWGLPQQKLEGALADLEAAIKLNPEHISWYQLTIEEKTEFARRPPQLPMEDTLQDIEQSGLDLLDSASYSRYEVSAFAKSGNQCLHNVNYWQFGDYVGIGAGAHGKVSQGNDILRCAKPKQPRLFLANPAQTETTLIPPDALPLEFMLNTLRLCNGVPQELFSQRTGLPWAEVQTLWAKLVDQGLVTEQHCATTAFGYRYLDSVVAEFLSAA